MEERDIIKGCKNREQTAYKALVDKYSAYLFAICKRYVSDSEKAKDCLQESLVQIISKIDKYEERGKFLSWMSAVTVKKCLDQIRKEKRFEARDIDDVLEPSVDENVNYKLQHDDVMEFLETLPQQYRIAINMFLIEGYSHKEIAEVLGVSESSSRSLVSRARKMIVTAFEFDERSGYLNKNDREIDQHHYKFKVIRS